MTQKLTVASDPIAIQMMPLTMYDNTLFKDEYIYGGINGRGAYGLVVQAIHRKSLELCAIKIISKSHSSHGELLKMRSEAHIMQQLDHPNIVKLKSVMESQDHIFIVMNQCKGGSLASLINERRVLSDKEVALIMKGILSGLNFIHMMGYLHRDIKPENILFARENDLSSIQISDFGLGAKYDHSFPLEHNLKCGTLLFMAPEQANSNVYSTNVDVWACGIIAYILVTGKHPLCNDVHMETERLLKILSKPAFTYPQTINPLAKSFIAQSCEVNPENRYSCLDCLNHPWITRNVNEPVQPSYVSKLKTSIEVDKLESVNELLDCQIVFVPF